MASAVVAAPGIAGPAAAMVSVVNHLGIIAGRNHAGCCTVVGVVIGSCVIDSIVTYNRVIDSVIVYRRIAGVHCRSDGSAAVSSG